MAPQAVEDRDHVRVSKGRQINSVVQNKTGTTLDDSKPCAPGDREQAHSVLA
jgi:hypothetical protein